MQTKDDESRSFCSERMKLCQKHLSKVYGRSKSIFLRDRGRKENSSVHPASSFEFHAKADDTHRRKPKVSPYLSAVCGLLQRPLLLQRLHFKRLQSSVAKSADSPVTSCPSHCKVGKREGSASVPVFFEGLPSSFPVPYRAPSWAYPKGIAKRHSSTASTVEKDDCIQAGRQGDNVELEGGDGFRSFEGVAAAPRQGMGQRELNHCCIPSRVSTIRQGDCCFTQMRRSGLSYAETTPDPVLANNETVCDMRKWSLHQSGSESRPGPITDRSDTIPQSYLQSRLGSCNAPDLPSEKYRLHVMANRNPYQKSPMSSVYKAANFSSRCEATGVDSIVEATSSSFSRNPGAPSFVSDLSPIRAREALGTHTIHVASSDSDDFSKPLLEYLDQPPVHSGDTCLPTSLVQSTESDYVNSISYAPAQILGPSALRPRHGSDRTYPRKDWYDPGKDVIAAVRRDSSREAIDSTISQSEFEASDASIKASRLEREVNSNIKRQEKSSSSLWRYGSMAFCTENPSRDYRTGASQPDFRVKHAGRKVNWSSSGSRKLVNHVCQVLKQHRWAPITLETLNSLNGRLTTHCVNAVIQRQTDPTLALKFFSWAKSRKDYKHDVYTYTTMINILGRARNLKGVKELLEEMHADGCEPTVVTYNTLILVYGKVESLSESLRVFRIMKEAGCEPDNVTYSILIHLCVKSGFLQEAMNLYHSMLEAGIQPDTITYSIVIDSLGKAGNLSEARRMFREMRDQGYVPNEFTYNSMIDRHAKSRKTKYALKYYQEMRNNGFQLNPVICTTMMSVLASLGQLSEAEGLFTEMQQAGIVADTAAYSLMINMWGQAGHLDKAVSWYGKLLGNLVTPSLTVFTSLVHAHLDQHLYEGAQHFLTSMATWGISPDLKVYTSLLRHCTGCERQEHVDAVLGLMDRLGHPAHKFVFELLTAKNQDRKNTRTRVENFFDSLQHEDQDSKQAFANALIEFLHKLQCKTDPGFVWEIALEKRLFPAAIIRRQAPNHWLIDLHSMSVGTALVALPRLLLMLRESWIRTPTKRVYIVTGWGKRSKVTGSSAMKQSVNDLLQAAKSPFSADHTNAGVFVSYGPPFCDWITDPSARRGLGLEAGV